MAFNHRKLFPDPANKNLRDGCAKYCDPLQNRGYICPAECFNACFPVCQAIITIQSPPPPPFSLVPPTPTPNTTTDYYPNKSHKHNLSLIISVTLASIFLIFCCYYFYKMQTAWYRSTGRADTQGGEESHGDLSDEYHRSEVDHPIWYIRTVGLQPSVIKAITICKYKRGDGLVEGTECSVCLNEFQEGENLRLLPKCNHAFHQSCIDNWLGSHISCPMCRGSVVRCPAAALPAREEGVHDSGTIERNQRGTPEINNNLETRRERENESYELRVRIQGEGDLQTENDSENQEFPTEEVLEVADIHPARRSNSVDSFSATITSAAATTDAHSRRQSVGNSGTLSDKANELDKTVVPKGVDANESLVSMVSSSIEISTKE